MTGKASLAAAKRGEGRGEVALISIEKQNPLTLTLSPVGRGEGNFRQMHNSSFDGFGRFACSFFAFMLYLFTCPVEPAPPFMCFDHRHTSFSIAVILVIS